MQTPARGSVLGQRDYRLLFLAQLLSGLGDGVSLVALSFAVLSLTGSLADLGLVLVARYGALSLGLVFAGVLGDRMPRRRLLLASDAARALLQAALALLLLQGWSDAVWLCAGVQALFGAAEALWLPALTGLVPQLVDRSRLREANAFNEMTFTVSRTLGPAVGGLLVLAVGAAGAVAFDALTFLGSLLLVRQVRVPDDRAARTPTSRLLPDLRAGWREVRGRPWVLLAVGTFTLLATVTIPAVLVLGPALSWRGLGGVAGWSALTSAFGVGALVGSVGAMRLEVPRPGVWLMVLLCVAGLRPLAFVSGVGLPAIAAYCFVAGAATSLATVVWFSLLQQHLPPTVLSRVSALDELGTSLLAPAGYLLAAPAAAALGLERCVLLLGTVPVVACLLALAAPSVRALSWTPPVRHLADAA